MGLFLRVRDGLVNSRVFRFDDTAERVVFGTNPTRCQVVFATRSREVAPEHCGLERVLGAYRWVLNGTHAVYVDGVRVTEGDLLPPHGTLRLGARGPRIFFSHGANAEVPTVRPLGRLRLGAARVQELGRHVQLNRLALVVVALVLLVVTAGGAMAISRVGGGGGGLDDETRLRAALDRAAPSIYRVVKRDADGSEYGYGTAFVVAPGRLATNVHVAQYFHDVEEGGAFLVRSAGRDPVTLTVTRVELHAGFDAFRLMWDYVAPVQGPEGVGEPVQSAGGACDVALLHVDEPRRLERALPLASDGQLASLRAGRPVGYVGYASEGLALAGSPVAFPVAKVQVGQLVAVTTFFGDVRDPADNQLLQHNCPGTGGASGSPLLDARGLVVGINHAGTFARGFGERIPSGAGVNFGQRIDVLRELMDGKASAYPFERLQAWEQRLARLYRAGGAAQRREDREAAFGRPLWSIGLAESERLRRGERPLGMPDARRGAGSFVRTRVELVDVPRRGDDPNTLTREFLLGGEGCHAVFVWRYGEAPTPVRLTARTRRGRTLSVRDVDGPGSARLYEVVSLNEGMLTMAFEPALRPARYHVEVHRAVGPISPVLLSSERILQAWQANLGETLGGRFDVHTVHQAHVQADEEAGTDGRVRAWEGSVHLAEPGLYLVEVHTVAGRGIELLSPGEQHDDLEVLRRHPHGDARAIYRFQPGSVFIRAEVRESADVVVGLLVRISRATRR